MPTMPQAPVAGSHGILRRSLLSGVTRNVVALGMVSLLTDISSELLVFLIPLFLANVLAATPTVVGVVEGITESASAFLKLGSGWLSDRLGRRKTLVVTGYATSTIAKAVYLVASAWPLVLLARLGDRVGKGIRTAPRDALIANSTSPEARGRAFGLHRAMDTAGATLGVAIAALVVNVMQGDALRLAGDTWRAVVLIALVPAAVAVVALVVGVHDVPGIRGPRAGRAGLPAAATETARPKIPPLPAGPSLPAGPLAASGPGDPPVRELPAAFWWYVAATALFTLGNSSDAFLALRSQDLGVAVRDLLLVLVAFNLVGALIAWPLGALSDRVGRRGLIAFGWGIYGLSYLGFAIAGRGAPVALLWIVYGAYYGINEAVGKALVADVVAPRLRATGYGIVNAVTGLALLPASIIAGLLWDRVAPAAPFWFGAACAGLAVGLLLLGRGRSGGRRTAPS